MTVYPVIMCGGAGSRLWPASRPSRPKQFIPLAGNRSLFQETVLRVAPLASGGGRLIVVGGVDHRDWILEQLAEVEVDAQVLLEPHARDSAPAMAAAAIWVDRRDPTGVMAFVASDHHLPDHEAFREAVRTAASSARAGRIVTLGVRPTEPSPAYGYIKPRSTGLSEVEAFIEKPDRATAADYIEAGYLWNSGNFIVGAATLLDELRTHAPGVEAVVRAALPDTAAPGVQVLAESFASAPRISIDYALMEKTRLASVLEVAFRWSDLGAWDAIAASGEGGTGIHIFEDAEGCLVRAGDGVLVAAMGVRNLAIVAEPDAILVCDLARAQDVKKLVERIRTTSPRHLDFARTPPGSLAEGARRFAEWMRLRALPVWSTLGQLEDGRFAEALSLDGRRVTAAHRARVQARQIYVYAQAGAMGWEGPWRRTMAAGIERLLSAYLRPDGLSRTLLDNTGAPLDETAMLYDQAFVLFALAAARSSHADGPALEARAVALRETLMGGALPNGGFREAGDHPFQSNAHMHLLEACLAWEAISDDPAWPALADIIAGLAMDRFIDREGGFIREFFREDWTPAEGEDGRLAEPGHQFEWAWLLTRYGRSRGDARAIEAARRLYAFGRSGVSERPRIALDAMNEDGSIRSARARLWPQTEWLKAALILADGARDGERAALLEDAAAAMRALWLYLTPDGLWRDKRLPGGAFIDEPSPASSLYHIMAALEQVSASGRGEGQEIVPVVDLGPRA